MKQPGGVPREQNCRRSEKVPAHGLLGKAVVFGCATGDKFDHGRAVVSAQVLVVRADAFGFSFGFLPWETISIMG